MRPDLGSPGGGLPGGPLLGGDVTAAMLARRVVLVHGLLDDDRASEVAACLMTLDASGDDRVVLRLTSVDGPLEAAFTLLDVIDVLGVPVDTVGVGTIAGGAVGVLAAGRSRRLGRHTRLRLREPDGSVTGRAVDIERAVADHAARRDRFLAHLASRTGRPVAEIAAEWSAGAVLDAEDAVTLGYADGLDEPATRPGG